MPASRTVNAVLLDAQKIIETWTANPSFNLGDLTLKGVSDLVQDLTRASEKVEATRLEMQGFMNDRDAKLEEMEEIITRARSGFRAVFGPDSTQYEQAGGVRKSERKVIPRARKPRQPVS